MKTININGKDYTKGDFVKACINAKLHQSPLSLIFTELQEAFPCHEPESPTVRTMSELPEANVSAHFLAEFEGSFFWTEGAICIGRIELRLFEQNCYKHNNYTSEKGIKLHKWLPFRTLPNPNDISISHKNKGIETPPLNPKTINDW
jgi:hypothetical protein